MLIIQRPETKPAETKQSRRTTCSAHECAARARFRPHLGNRLGATLLSSIPGASVFTQVASDDALARVRRDQGVRTDGHRLILNLKDLSC